jgi:hypothetical protein
LLAVLATLLMALAGWVPWSVTPLYGLLLARAGFGTRPSAVPDRSVMIIGVSEGIVTIMAGAWIVLAFMLAT